MQVFRVSRDGYEVLLESDDVVAGPMSGLGVLGGPLEGKLSLSLIARSRPHA